jgi:hypothetical protein
MFLKRETRSTGRYLNDYSGTIECRVCGQKWWWMGRGAHLSNRGRLMCPEGCTRPRTDNTKVGMKERSVGNQAV